MSESVSVLDDRDAQRVSSVASTPARQQRPDEAQQCRRRSRLRDGHVERAVSEVSAAPVLSERLNVGARAVRCTAGSRSRITRRAWSEVGTTLEFFQGDRPIR